MSTKNRQTVTFDVMTTGDRSPLYTAEEAVRDAEGVVDVWVKDWTPVQEMTLDRKRLVDMVAWVAGEHAKLQLGLPSEWYQGAWLKRANTLATTEGGCGTACCFAGKVAIADGGVPVVNELGDWDRMREGMDTGRVVFPDLDPEKEVSVSEYARDVLGLTERQADRLFAGSNTYEDIVAVVRDILREADAEDQPERPTRTVRQLRASRRTIGACRQGTDCDICYEDVEVSLDEAEAANA